jgi:hypothetical protein
MHKHHIIPKHMGGTDDPDNIIVLSVKEHAIAHAKLYLEHGNIENYLAYKGLRKQIGKEEIFRECSRMGGLNNKGKPKSKSHSSKISKANKNNPKLQTPHTEERKQNISQSMKGNKNSSNHSSPEFRHKQSEVMKKAWAKRKLK